MQQVVASFEDGYRTLTLPDPEELVLPGVKWGRHEHPLTPAFWVSQSWMFEDISRGEFRLGASLAEEVAVCLLGGHGAPAEVGLAAFARVRDELQRRQTDVLPVDVLEELLIQPLTVRGRPVRYRFARQRAKYLAGALDGLRSIDEEVLDDIGFRDAMCRLPGIGPKTASWIVRNRRASDRVAILDVHIVRACWLMGVFPLNADPARHYRRLELRFLEFCERTSSRASALDAVMWGTMRKLSGKFMRLLVDRAAVMDEYPPSMQVGDGKCPEAAAQEEIGHPAARRVAERRRGVMAEQGELLLPIPA